MSIGFAQREKQAIVRELCQELGVRFVDYPPQTVKRALTGSARASKAQVAMAVRGMLGCDLHDEHACDAAAIALLARSRRMKPPAPLGAFRAMSTHPGRSPCHLAHPRAKLGHSVRVLHPPKST